MNNPPLENSSQSPSCASRLLGWVDSYAASQHFHDDDQRLDWLRNLPFVVLHIACLAAWWTGVSPVALVVMALLFVVRMFAITAVYHRLLAHRAYQAPRWLTFFGSLVANSSGQRGPLWWASHHRLHHRDSDEAADIHSPVVHSFIHAHMLWFMTSGAFRTRLEMIPDFAQRVELRLLDRFDWLSPLLLAVACFALGAWLNVVAPGLGTNGWQMLVWGFVVSTVVLAHATFTVNSLCHTWGGRAYATPDQSRNNWLIALITLGEGWHNNHHRYPLTARQGFRWWQYDPTWWTLCGMQVMGLIQGLKPVPQRVVDEGYPARRESGIITP